jgi:hypothetical protein
MTSIECTAKLLVGSPGLNLTSSKEWSFVALLERVRAFGRSPVKASIKLIESGIKIL